MYDSKQLHMDDLNHEMAVQTKYGSNVHHISNFDNCDLHNIEKACKQLPNVFIGLAFIGDGSRTDSSMSGVYTYDLKYITKFWDIFNKRGK